MNIKLIRLQTGEDLIADVTIDSDGDIKLENPCMVYVRPNSTNTGASVGLTRWMPYAEAKTFTIDTKWVVIVTDPATDLKNEYNKAFGSGIVVPPTSIQVAN
jgi:hypothetical protein